MVLEKVTRVFYSVLNVLFLWSYLLKGELNFSLKKLKLTLRSVNSLCLTVSSLGDISILIKRHNCAGGDESSSVSVWADIGDANVETSAKEKVNTAKVNPTLVGNL